MICFSDRAESLAGALKEWEAIVLRETGLGESSSSGSSSPMSLVRR